MVHNNAKQCTTQPCSVVKWLIKQTTSYSMMRSPGVQVTAQAVKVLQAHLGACTRAGGSPPPPPPGSPAARLLRTRGR
jgi:hypothetical protein